MGIALLVIPVVNRLLVCRPPAEKQVPITMIATALRSFTNHMEIEGDKPNLLKIFVDPVDTDNGLDAYLDEIVFHHKDKWAAEWAIPDIARLDVLDFKNTKSDKEVTVTFFKVLKETLDDQALVVKKKSKLDRARIILVASGETNEVTESVASLDETSVIALKNAELDGWVYQIVSERGWTLLKSVKKNLITSERSLKEANKSVAEWKARAEVAEKEVSEKERDLSKMETYLWKEGPRVFLKVLEDEGFLMPKRRTCQICKDSREHQEPTVEREEINQSGNIEERCPLFSVDQRCQQCSNYPPTCYSNNRVNVCQRAEENPCMRHHFGILPVHTSAIHHLDPEEDLELIRSLVNTHGGCNFPEFAKFAKIEIYVEDELSME